jgi:hypothetical protein
MKFDFLLGNKNIVYQSTVELLGALHVIEFNEDVIIFFNIIKLIIKE